MNMQKPLKCAAAMLSAILAVSASCGMITAETTLSGSETTEITSAASASEAAMSGAEDTKSVKSEWWKAEITDYDSSLSLISYELTPDITQTETDEDRTDNSDDSDIIEENGSDQEELSAPQQEDTAVSPTPVESQTTGGTVSNVPQSDKQTTVNAKSGEFAFTTYGWGHCVGMSQNGANFYATYGGWSYQDILYHYYPGTYLMNTGTAATEQITVSGITGDVVTLLSGVVYNEMGGSMNTEALKAQAVAAYTYLKYYGNNGRDLIYKANPPQKVIDAVTSVLGQALYYNGNFAMTVFTASSGGATANCYDVFSNDIPYLRSVTSDYDSAYDPHYGSVKYIASSEVKRLVEARYGVSLSDNPANWFQPVIGDGGFVTEVVIDGQKTVRGYDLKICLGLKSSKFEITYGQ
ncbi:MAG: SpoIID/LytB domain-containing protein [Oscillospiraceae bacterium]|nr:SpoIID/LytB domain-containing protein [Oscillospiraceae bacterium]